LKSVFRRILRFFRRPQKPRIYVSGPSKDLERCERAIAICKELGAEITFDWTKPIREWGLASPTCPDVCLSAAKADLQGVADCHVMLFLDGETASPGRWVEFGAAYAAGKPIVGCLPGSARWYLWYTLLTERLPGDALHAACARAVQLARGIVQGS
jgi:hypothetical protein